MIRTYFSHSYWPEDQPLNQAFWKVFAQRQFAFAVDPPSHVIVHAHLERMMRRSQCYVAIVSRRLDVPRRHCSPFILYEYGLGLQAQLPMLLLIDKRIDPHVFGPVGEEHMFQFNPDDPEERREELVRKVEELRKRALPDRAPAGRRPIGLVVQKRRAPGPYGGRTVKKSLEEAADRYGFSLRTIEVPHDENAYLALAFERCEAVIVDVRGDEVPEWVFAYLWGRFVPTIRVAHLRPHETAHDLPLPPLVEGLQMDRREPSVESVIYWRTGDDLLHQLMRAFEKLDDDPTVLRDERVGVRYFESIGRRHARVFISNSGDVNELGKTVARELNLYNIECFQYKTEAAIRTGSDWQKKILHELNICEVFVALISASYEKKPWCMREMREALHRAKLGQIEILPYNIGGADVSFVRTFQVNELSADIAEAAEQVCRDVNQQLRKGKTGERVNQLDRLLGGSTEAITDALMCLTSTARGELKQRLAKIAVNVEVPGVEAKTLPRRAAEEILRSLDRVASMADAPRGQDPVRGFLRELERVVPEKRKGVLKDVRKRIELLGSAGPGISREGDALPATP